MAVVVQMAEYVDTMGKQKLTVKKSTDSLFLQPFHRSNYARRKELLSWGSSTEQWTLCLSVGRLTRARL